MENNSLKTSPLPAPGVGSNMPAFGPAPVAAPAPAPSASTMPSFGAPSIAPQPVQPAPAPAPQPAQPVSQPMPAPAVPAMSPAYPTPGPAMEPAQPAPAPAPVMPAQPVMEPAQPSTSSLGEIMNEITMASAPDPFQPQQPPVLTEEQISPASPATPFVEAQSTIPTVNSQPVAAMPEQKQPNIKLFALIGAAAVLLVGVIIIFVMMMSQPQPTTNPADAPQPDITKKEVDTSLPFSDLTSAKALEFLSATADDETYYPEGYVDEEVIDALGSKSFGMLYSYETKDQILTIAKESTFAEKFKDKITIDTMTVDQREKYAFVSFDQKSTKCDTKCNAIIFDKKYVNFYSEKYTDVLTGIATDIVHIMLPVHDRQEVSEYAPLIAAVFMNGMKIYGAELGENNGTFDYLVHTIDYTNDNKNTATATTTHFKVIQTGEFLYVPDQTTSSVL